MVQVTGVTSQSTSFRLCLPAQGGTHFREQSGEGAGVFSPNGGNHHELPLSESTRAAVDAVIAAPGGTDTEQR